jgi:PAS domain S-box-containing protein
MGGAGIVFLLAGLLLAFIFARRVSVPIRELSSMADALGKGLPIPTPAASGVVEVDALAQDLNLAADLLEKRSHERDKVEARLREKEESLQRHADLLELAGVAIFGWEMDGPILYWNRDAEKLYGIASGNAIGRSSREVLTALFPGIDFDLKPMLEDTGEWIGELKHVTRDGRPLIIERHVRLVRERSGRGLVLESNRDITSRKQFVQRLSTEHAVTLILSESTTLQEAVGRILQAIGEGLEWGFGRFWVVSENRENIRCLETWHDPSTATDTRVTISPLLFNAGLPGKVWAKEEPVGYPMATRIGTFGSVPVQWQKISDAHSLFQSKCAMTCSE